MKISKDDFNAQLNEFVVTRVMPGIENKISLFVVAGAVRTHRVGTDMVGDTVLKVLGVMDADGKIDTEALRSFMTEGMKGVEDDLHLKLLGLHFHQTDVDRLFAFLESKNVPPSAAA